LKKFPVLDKYEAKVLVEKCEEILHGYPEGHPECIKIKNFIRNMVVKHSL